MKEDLRWRIICVALKEEICHASWLCTFPIQWPLKRALAWGPALQWGFGRRMQEEIEWRLVCTHPKNMPTCQHDDTHYVRIILLYFANVILASKNIIYKLKED